MANNKFNYRIFPEKRLVLERYCGQLDIRDLLEYQLLLSKDKEFSPNYHELYDLRDAEFVFHRSEIATMIYFLQNNTNLIGERRVVHLTKSPNHVAHSMLFQSAAESLPMDVKTVSTIETAIAYLYTQKEEIPFIESILEELAWGAAVA